MGQHCHIKWKTSSFHYMTRVFIYIRPLNELFSWSCGIFYNKPLFKPPHTDWNELFDTIMGQIEPFSPSSRPAALPYGRELSFNLTVMLNVSIKISYSKNIGFDTNLDLFSIIYIYTHPLHAMTDRGVLQNSVFFLDW